MTDFNRTTNNPLNNRRFRTADPADEYIGSLIKFYLNAHGCHMHPLLELPEDAYGDPMEQVIAAGTKHLSNPQEHPNTLFLNGNDSNDRAIGLLKELGLNVQKVPGMWCIPDHMGEKSEKIEALQIDITHTEELDKALDTILRDNKLWTMFNDKRNKSFFHVAPHLQQRIHMRPLPHPLHDELNYYQDSEHPEFTMVAAHDDSEVVKNYEAWLDDQITAALGEVLLNKRSQYDPESVWTTAAEQGMTDKLTAWLHENDPEIARNEPPMDPDRLARRIVEGEEAATLAQSRGAIFAHEVAEAKAAIRAGNRPRGPLDYVARETGSQGRNA